jgi:hypothetical protein
MTMSRRKEKLARRFAERVAGGAAPQGYPGTDWGAPRERGVHAASGLGAIGIESEFSVFLDGQPVKPEDVFGSPTAIVRDPMMHRTGRSYHLPTGTAVYFDTGVIELATPMIELAPSCAARAGRSLWEGILYLREELDHWERRHGREVQLAGFSTHYNVSYDIPKAEQTRDRNPWTLAVLMTHLLAIPVMLLAANRRSTGIGARPRPNRLEITADFTPDAALMIATATLIVGVLREVMTWPAYRVEELARRGLPMLRDFTPVPHSSRKGWVAKYSCYERNPFTADLDDETWTTTAGERLSLRQFGARVVRHFRGALERYGDPRSLRLIDAVMERRRLSLLELADRPASYDDVGRACRWDDLFPEGELTRSRYERVVRRTVSREPLQVAEHAYHPTGMRGWGEVVFRRAKDGQRKVFTLDELLRHIDRWDPRAD